MMAFSQLDVQANETQLDLIWIIAPNYYLYRHAFELSYQDGENLSTDSQTLPTHLLRLNNGLKTQDDYFGPVEVYYHQARASIELSHLMSLPHQSKTDDRSKGYLVIKYQGCAEAGLCYPVQSHQIALDSASASASPL